MISGRDALTSLRGTIDEQQRRARELDAELSAAAERLTRLDAARATELQGLARTRLAGLDAGQVTERIDDADRRATALLERRRAQQDELEARLAELDEVRAGLERERDAAAAALERAAAAVDEADAATQARLADDPEHRRLLETARDAERVAVHADEKASLAESERETKGEAYRADPLFTYLWERRFGTPDYRPGGGPFGPLLRWLDGRVARLIGYADAAANYGRLTEIPVRLREHAERVGERADAELAALATYEQAARATGGLPELDAARDRAAEAVAEVDARIAAAAEERDAALAQLERFATGEDETLREARAFLASELGREDLLSLRRDALATPLPDDDLIVARLLDLEEERERLAASVAELRAAADRNRGRVRELEDLRGEFTRQGYDAPGSTFDGATVATVMGQFLSGMLTSDALWRVLEQQRRYRPPSADPTFGSGGFGRGTPWGGAAPRARGGDGGDAVRTIGKVIGGLAKASGGGKGAFGGTRRASGGFKGGGRFKTGGRF
jgi:hypothetical protein